jgi:hypothetical protein
MQIHLYSIFTRKNYHLFVINKRRNKRTHIHAERARIETHCDFNYMQSRVMTWQPHCSGDPLPKAGDESEHTQVW